MQSKIDQTWCRSCHKIVHLVPYLCVIETGKVFIVLVKMYYLNIPKSRFHSLFEIYMRLLALLVMMAFLLHASRPRHNVILKRIFLSENIRISIKNSLNLIPRGPINNIPALAQIMAWCLSGNKPLSEPMMVSFLMHLCVTRPQWVKTARISKLVIYCNWSKWNTAKIINITDNAFNTHSVLYPIGPTIVLFDYDNFVIWSGNATSKPL